MQLHKMTHVHIKEILIVLFLTMANVIYGSHPLQWLEMENKPAPVGIARTRPRFDEKSPHWLGMGMGMGNPRLFQLGMWMVMGMYIAPPYLHPHLHY